MDNIKSLEWRYATKKFDAQRILSPEKITILKKGFNLTPTSYGLQPVKLVIVKNKNLQKKLFTHSARQQQISTASHVLVFCIETTIDSFFIEENFNRVKAIRKTPDKILQPFREFLLRYFEELSTEEKEAWATKQAYLTLGNLLNICATEGIDACPMEGFDAKKYDEILNLPEKGLQSVLVLPVGFRAKDDDFADFKKVRRPIEEVIVEIT